MLNMYAEAVKEGVFGNKGSVLDGNPHMCNLCDATYHIRFSEDAEALLPEYSFAASNAIAAEHPNHTAVIVLDLTELKFPHR